MLPPTSHPDLVPIEVWHGFGLRRLLLPRRPAGRREQRKEKGEWSIRDVGEEGASGGCPWDLPAPFFTVLKCSSRVRMGVCFWNPGRPVLSRVWSLRSLTGRLLPFAGGQPIWPQLVVKASCVNLCEGTQFFRWKRKMLDIGSLLSAPKSYQTGGS